MILAYICWEFRAPTPEGVEANKRAARELAKRVNAIPGWRAIVPHNFSEGIESSLTDQQWLEMDIEVMRRAADVLVYSQVHSASSGCRDERSVFAGAQIEERRLEDTAAELGARMFSRALRRGRC